MSSVTAFLGFLGGVIVGAALAFVLFAEHTPYSRWLGRTCWVRPLGRAEWTKHVIVAVSWRGAVCVRDAEHMNEDGYWIKKQNVNWRVRWTEPKEETK